MFTRFFITALLLASLARPGGATAPQQDGAAAPPQAGRVLAVGPDVVVAFSGRRPSVRIRGWERNEVRAMLPESEAVELRRVAEGAGQATRVVVSTETDNELRLDVPRGARVEVKTDTGDIRVEDVAEARAESRSGRIEMRRVARVAIATSISGSVVLRGVTGAVRLRTVSGPVELADASPAEAGDQVQVNSVSGDLLLERIAHSRVEAETTSGSVTFVGSPATAASCELRTMLGDLTLLLPEDASFQVDARVGAGGRILNDFTGRRAAGQAARADPQHFVGAYGDGGPTLRLVSFNGVIRLRRLK